MHVMMNPHDPAAAEIFKELFGRLVMCKLECMFSIKTISKDRTKSESRNLFHILFDNEESESSMGVIEPA
jgi:hypothetical protein